MKKKRKSLNTQKKNAKKIVPPPFDSGQQGISITPPATSIQPTTTKCAYHQIEITRAGDTYIPIPLPIHLAICLSMIGIGLWFGCNISGYIAVYMFVAHVMALRQSVAFGLLERRVIAKIQQLPMATDNAAAVSPGES